MAEDKGGGGKGYPRPTVPRPPRTNHEKGSDANYQPDRSERPSTPPPPKK